ncbi:MAG: hypothetical protein QOE23_725 [Pseudonocardiales bacterium]|jgi:hypothetical protein|nr:hypothetical protein [Pseudonocardiales bacterium]
MADRPQRRLPDLLDPLVIVGVVISFAAAVGTSLAGQQHTIAALVALVGLTVTFQLETLSKIEAIRRDETEAQAVFQRITALGAPMAARVQKVISATEQAVITSKGQNRLAHILSNHTSREIDELVDELEKVSSGRLDFDYWHSDLLLDALAGSRREIRASSPMDVDLTWWESPIGQRYLHAHEAVMSRGVRASRIFLLDPHADRDRAVRVMRQQAEAGIKVSYVSLAELPTELRKAFVLFDGDGLHRTEVGAKGEMNYFSINSTDIQRFMRIFDRLVSVSTTFVG